MADTTRQPLLAATLDLQQLPDDTATLKGLIVELAQALQDQQQHASHLQVRLDQLLHRLYGRRSKHSIPANCCCLTTVRRPVQHQPLARTTRLNPNHGPSAGVARMVGNVCRPTCHATSAVTN